MRLSTLSIRIFAGDAAGMEVPVSSKDFMKLRIRANLSRVAACFLLVVWDKGRALDRMPAK